VEKGETSPLKKFYYGTSVCFVQCYIVTTVTNL